MLFSHAAAATRSLLAVCSILLLTAVAHAQPVTWTGGGDGASWNQAANWSPAALPGPTSDVVIPAGATTINVNVAATIHSLTTDRPVAASGCSLLTITSGVTFTSSAGSLSTSTSFCDSIKLQGSQSVSGPGQLIVRSGTLRFAGAGNTITIAAGATVQQSGSGDIAVDASVSLVNSGQFRANATGQSMNITGPATASFTNGVGGVVEASTSGAVTFTTLPWANNGTLLINGGTLTLGGVYASLGTVSRTGGTLNVSGSYTGATLTANASTGVLSIGPSTTLTGTVLNATDGQSFAQNGGITLSNVTLNAPLSQASNCSAITITGGLTLGSGGSITTPASFCQTLVFSGTQAISGTGTINLNNGTLGVSGASAVLTVGPGVTIQGTSANGSIGIASGNSLINQGTLRANAAGRGLSISGAGSFTNAPGGTVEASSSGSVDVAAPTWTNSGTFLINAGTLNLSGSYAALGAINRTGGTLNLSGTYTGATLTANAATGPITLVSGFVLANATMTVADGQSFSQNGSFSLTNVTLNAPLALSGCSAVTISGGLTFGAGGSITTGASFCQTLNFSGTQTLGGTGTITLNNGSLGVTGTNATLSVGPGVIIQAGNTNGSIVINTGNTLINQGTLRANAASRELSIGGAGTFTNSPNGTVEASASGIVDVAAASWSNNSTYLINAGTLNLSGSYSALGTITRTGGTLNLAGSYTGATLTANATTGSIGLGSGFNVANTTLNVADGQSFSQTGSFSLTNVTLNAPLTLTGCSAVTISGGLTLGPSGSITTGTSFCQTINFSGTQTLSGTGIITLNAGSMGIIGTNATLTVGPGVIIQAGSTNCSITIPSGNAMLNQGTLRANAAGRNLSVGGIGTCTVAPGGVVEAAAGGSVDFTQGSWTNNGTFRINAGSLNLGGTYPALGTIDRTGGTLTLTGAYTGTSLTANAATGSMVFGSGLSITNATISVADGQSFSQSGGFSFSNVTLNAPLTLSGCSVLTVTNGLVLGAAGSITTGNSFCQSLTFSGTQSVTGSGSISLNAGSMAVSGTSATLTLGPSITLNAIGTSSSLTVGAGNSLVNTGTVRVSGAGRVLTLGGTGSLTNAPGATLEVSAGASLTISNLTWANNGTLVVNNGTANLGGTCAGLGTISRSGGTINLTANYTGTVLTISNATGPINFGGNMQFSGTTLNALDGQTYGLSGGATFNAVTLNAPINLSGCSVLTVTGGLALGATGSVTTGSSFCQNLAFSGTQTLSGTGSITLNNGTMTVSGSGAVLTVAPGVTIQAGSANGAIQVADGASMVNQGRLLASGVNKSLQIGMSSTGTFTNDTAGVVEANTSGTIVLNITSGNSGTLRAGTNGTITVSANRTLTNAANATIEIQGSGLNQSSSFGRVRVLGNLVAGGALAVTYPDGLVQGCVIGVSILSTQSSGAITGTFASRVGPVKPAPFASLIAISGGNYFFTSTNQADVGSAGGVAQADGILDNNDFIVYIDLFFATNPIADRGTTGGVAGSDGVFDNNDFIVYIDQFFAGCG